MIINGVELEFDPFDMEEAEKLEKAFEALEQFKEEDFEGLKDSEVIRIFCNKTFEAFNQVFGEGTDKKLFGNKTNMKLCIEAIIQVREQKTAEANALNAALKKTNQKPRRSK